MLFPARTAAVAGAALIACAAVLLSCGGDVQQGGAAERSLAASSPAPTPTSGPASQPAAPGPSIADGSLPTAGAQTAPVRIRIPAIGVTAAVVPVGVRTDGQLDPPEQVSTVGWYRYGPGLEGTRGSVVVAGHVDDREQGQGAFFQLGKLRIGDVIELDGPAGAPHRFRVVARQQWSKTEVPLDRLFSLDGAYRLTLITCGGAFDSGARSYLDNIAVTAVPT